MVGIASYGCISIALGISSMHIGPFLIAPIFANCLHLKINRMKFRNFFIDIKEKFHVGKFFARAWYFGLPLNTYPMNRRYKKKLLNVSAIKEEIPGSEPGACSIGSCTHLLRGGLPYVRVSAFDRFGYWTPSKVSGPPLNPPSNPFGNAFYSVGSGLIRGGLGKHEFSDLQFLFPFNPNNTILAIQIAQQNSEGLWTITEPVGGQHSYKPPIDGICYELGPYRHLIRSIRKGQSRGASFSKYCCCKVLLVSVGGGDAPLLE
ncbi:hypothetical protein GOBAR_DD23828 [Gossypium barbadense]|nr:hypothetical protein GOBAR_DD23828 [Gossypium barbadense]